MSRSVKTIVEAWVNLKNRGALEEMREQRERVRKNMLKIDDSKFTDSDITEIDVGLSRLQISAGDRPRPKQPSHDASCRSSGGSPFAVLYFGVRL